MLKSKNGFTLIELLVVIGILAVLAAIAIPTVAGLIDKAKASADQNNAKEMTNAIERFANEYEMYKTDISMGVIPNPDPDGLQGRVFAVTGATKRDNITALEKDGFDGKAVDSKTMYPANEETTVAVIQVYLKTNYKTFTPKQSDKHFFYTPSEGITIVANTNATVEEKNEIAGIMYANNGDLNKDTVWFDITIAGTPCEHTSTTTMNVPYRLNRVICNTCNKVLDEGTTCPHENTTVEVGGEGYKDGITCNDCTVVVQEKSPFTYEDYIGDGTVTSMFTHNGIKYSRSATYNKYVTSTVIPACIRSSTAPTGSFTLTNITKDYFRDDASYIAIPHHTYNDTRGYIYLVFEDGTTPVVSLTSKWTATYYILTEISSPIDFDVYTSDSQEKVGHYYADRNQFEWYKSLSTDTRYNRAPIYRDMFTDSTTDSQYMITAGSTTNKMIVPTCFNYTARHDYTVVAFNLFFNNKATFTIN